MKNKIWDRIIKWGTLGSLVFSSIAPLGCDKVQRAIEAFRGDEKQTEQVEQGRKSPTLEKRVGLQNYEEAEENDVLQEGQLYLDNNRDTIKVLVYSNTIKEWLSAKKMHQEVGKDFTGGVHLYLNRNNIPINTSGGWPGIYNLIADDFSITHSEAPKKIQIQEKWGHCDSTPTNFDHSFLLQEFNISEGEVNIRGFYSSGFSGEKAGFYIYDIQSSQYSKEEVLVNLALDSYDQNKELPYFKNILKELKISSETVELLAKFETKHLPEEEWHYEYFFFNEKEDIKMGYYFTESQREEWGASSGEKRTGSQQPTSSEQEEYIGETQRLIIRPIRSWCPVNSDIEAKVLSKPRLYEIRIITDYGPLPSERFGMDYYLTVDVAFRGREGTESVSLSNFIIGVENKYLHGTPGTDEKRCYGDWLPYVILEDNLTFPRTPRDEGVQASYLNFNVDEYNPDTATIIFPFRDIWKNQIVMMYWPGQEKSARITLGRTFNYPDKEIMLTPDELSDFRRKAKKAAFGN